MIRPWHYLVLMWLFAPTGVQAAVMISEVAWMGSAESANHEWIELFASSGSVNVDGWTLADSNNLSITLSGTISGGSYVVLERTSDASAAGTAFVIYTGALVNSGATLTLRDAAGDIVDQVVGGDAWDAIGGDNDTKETAQKTNSGWGTAAATPGSGSLTITTTADPDADDTDATDGDDADDTTTPNTTTQSSSDGGGDAIVLTLPDVTLQLDMVVPQFVYVHQPFIAVVNPSGVGAVLENSLQYDWNFGDGTTGGGQEVQHQYDHPGRYVVVVDAGYKRQQQIARTEITVLPVEVSLTVGFDGYVALTNDGDSEIDLGGYRVVGRESVVLPRHTIVLPGETIRVTEGKLGTAGTPSMIALYDQAGDMVSTGLTKAAAWSAPMVPTAATIATAPTPTVASIAPTPRISALRTHEVIDQSPSRLAVAETAVVQSDLPPSRAAREPAPSTVRERQSAQLADSATTLPTQWPLYALVGLLLLGCLALYFVPGTAGRGDVS